MDKILTLVEIEDRYQSEWVLVEDLELDEHLRVTVERVEALGQARSDFSVVSHTLPPSASVDGLLGLDFIRGQVLTIDFRAGEVSLV